MKQLTRQFKHYADAKISRRTFLTGGAIIGASAAAVAIAPNVAVAASDVQKDEAGKENKKDEGYRLTQHIADYYKSAAL